jgi:hypothetical protein
MAARTVTIWSVTQGRLAEFLEVAKKARVIQERLGAKCRLGSMAFAGPNTGQLVYTMEHASLADLAAFNDRLGADPEWQKLWAAEMAGNKNPVGTIMSHSIVSDVPGF